MGHSEYSGYSEFEDSYDTNGMGRGSEFESALLSHSIRHLEPALPVWVNPEDSVEAVVETMSSEKIGCVLVGNDKQLAGIFTERDLMCRVVRRGGDPTTIRVADVMTADPDCLAAEDRVAYALKKMVLRGFRHIPVTNAENQVVGVLSVRDIAKYVASLYPEVTLNLPPGDRLRNPSERDGG